MQAGGDNTPRPGKECPGLERTICGAHTGHLFSRATLKNSCLCGVYA